MKIKDLILELQELDQELPVCISKNDYVEEISTIDSPYVGPYMGIYDGPKLVFRREQVLGKYLLIGDFGDMIDYSKHKAL